jgi:hypothetical protein
MSDVPTPTPDEEVEWPDPGPDPEVEPSHDPTTPGEDDGPQAG